MGKYFKSNKELLQNLLPTEIIKNKRSFYKTNARKLFKNLQFDKSSII